MESEDEEQDSESYESEEESYNRGASPNTQIKRGYQSKVLDDKKRAKRKLNYWEFFQSQWNIQASVFAAVFTMKNKKQC